ncbi:MAG: exonuclease SbcC [Flavobacterium sp.]|jgi:exonuclease SbcC
MPNRSKLTKLPIKKAFMKLSEILESTPKWQHKNAAVRLKCLQNSTLESRDICSLATNDEDLAVRLCAVGLLDDIQSLALLQKDPLEEINSASLKRWTALVGCDLALFSSLSTQITSSQLIALAQNAELLTIKLSAVSLLSCEDDLAQILHHQNHTKIHQLCADMLISESLLEEVQKQFLHKDKNVIKIVKQKLQFIKSERAQKRANFEKFEKCYDGIVKLSKSEYSEAFPRRFETLVEQRSNLKGSLDGLDDKETDSEKYSELNLAFERCEKIITKRKQKIFLAAESADRAKQLLDELTFALRQSSASSSQEIRGALEDVKTLYPLHHESAKFQSQKKELEFLIQQYGIWERIQSKVTSSAPSAQLKALKEIQWPVKYDKPKEIAEIAALAEKAQAKLLATESSKKAELSNIQHQLDQLASTIKDGKLKQAQRIHHVISTQEKDLPAIFTSALDALTTKLRDLQDWQGFATIPKREALCDEMASLADNNSISEPEKARLIKDLQQQWKGLGASDSQKAQKLWGKFRKYSEIAYAPCARYFANQRELRHNNLKEKEKICQALESLFNDVTELESNWGSRDWKNLSEVIVVAQKEWRRFDEISRSKFRPIQNRFNKVVDDLYGKLKAERTANHDVQAKLIESVQQLALSDIDVADIIEQTKAIQSEWKAIGITDRKVGQTLWKQFRAACDQVFSLRKEAEKRDQQQALDLIKIAKAICQSLKSLIDSDELIQQSHIRTFKNDFNELANDNQLKEVKKTFLILLKEANIVIEEQSKSSHKAKLMELRRKAKLCETFELAEHSLETIQGMWDGDIALDESINKLISKRLYEPREIDLVLKEQLCIRLEILAEIDSPPESQRARMAYQVERLNRELSKGQKETRTIAEQIEEIQVLWYSEVTNKDSQDLSKRFSIAEAKLM